ncbi:MAG: hypothetical protein F7C35_06050 [Desulfurococcales archaeon]|nr:hypothetical protein [Desulfurococcales archaeon]
MPGGEALWRVLMDLADEAERLSNRLRGPDKRSVARLAGFIIEGLAWKALDGDLTPQDLEKLDEVSTLFRLHDIPLEVLRRAREVILSGATLSRAPERGMGILTVKRSSTILVV